MHKPIVQFLILYFGISTALFSQPLTLFPEIAVKGNARVTSITQLASGEYLIGGEVDRINGASTGNLVKVDQSGNLVTTFNQIIVDNYYFKTHELPDGKILVGGWFKFINGISASLVRLNSDGTLDNTFEKFELEGSNGIHSFVVQSDGKIVIAGLFIKKGYPNLLRLNADGSVDTTFTIFNTSMPYLSNLLLGAGDYLFVTDGYTLHKLNSEGIPTTNFPSEFTISGYINDMKLSGNQVVLGGNFTKVNGVDRTNLAIINYDGSVDSFSATNVPVVTELNVTVQQKIIINFINSGVTVYSLNGSGVHLPPSKSGDKVFIDSSQRIIIAGSKFRTFQNPARSYIIRLFSDLSEDTSFICKPAYTNGLFSIATYPDDRFLVSVDNSVATINNSSDKIVRINLDGTVDTSFHPEVSPSPAVLVSAMLVQEDDKIWVGTNSLIRLLPSGSRDPDFNEKILTGPYLNILKLKLNQGRVVASGHFNTIDNYASPGIVMFNQDGSINSSFSSKLPNDCAVFDFDFQTDNKIIVAGFFNIDGILKNVLRLHEDGTIDESFTMGRIGSNSISCVKIDSNDKIYLGGSFYNYNSIPRRFIVRLTSNGDLDLSFSPTLQTSSESSVLDLALLSDNEILISAYSINYNSSLKALDADGNVIHKPYTQLGYQSIPKQIHFDGYSLYMIGRFVSAGLNTVSAISFLNLRKISGAISNLQASRTLTGDVNITWNSSLANAYSLIVERSQTNNGSFNPIDTIPASNSFYLDQTSSEDVGYYYKIKAINSNSSSDYSNEAYVAPKLVQTILFDNLPEQTFGINPFELSAVATSGLEVIFSSSNSDIASVSGKVISIHKAGIVTITAQQAGNGTYKAASPIERVLVIKKANQQILFEVLPDVTIDDEFIVVNASATSTLDVNLSSSNESIATINGLTVTLQKVGTVSLTASQAGNENYEAALPVTRQLRILPSTITGIEWQSDTSTIYPNPGTGIFRILLQNEFSNGECSIITASGIVKDKFPVRINNGYMDIDLSNLQSGLYLVQIVNGENHVYHKIIKK